MGKVVPLSRIKDNEEYEKVQKELIYLGKMIAWISDSDIDHVATIDGIINNLNQKENKDEKALWEIQSLKNMRIKIEQGNYRDELLKDFTARTIQAEQYEREQKSMEPSEVIKGALTGKVDAIKYRYEQTLIDRVNKFGIVAEPGYNQQYETSEQVLNDIINNYEFVGIPLEKLLPVPIAENSYSEEYNKTLEEVRNITKANIIKFVPEAKIEQGPGKDYVSMTKEPNEVWRNKAQENDGKEEIEQ